MSADTTKIGKVEFVEIGQMAGSKENLIFTGFPASFLRNLSRALDMPKVVVYFGWNRG